MRVAAPPPTPLPLPLPRPRFPYFGDLGAILNRLRDNLPTVPPFGRMQTMGIPENGNDNTVRTMAIPESPGGNGFTIGG